MHNLWIFHNFACVINYYSKLDCNFIVNFANFWQLLQKNKECLAPILISPIHSLYQQIVLHCLGKIDDSMFLFKNKKKNIL